MNCSLACYHRNNPFKNINSTKIFEPNAKKDIEKCYAIKTEESINTSDYGKNMAEINKARINQKPILDKEIIAKDNQIDNKSALRSILRWLTFWLQTTTGLLEDQTRQIFTRLNYKYFSI